MLRIQQLEAYYGKIKALKSVDIEVAPGELVTLIGANGAGKTTTLHSIVGLVRERKGTITFNGRDISRIRADESLSLGIALVPEGRWVFPELTVEENLRIGAFSQRGKVLAQRLAQQYELFPVLKERRKQKGGTLSGGEQQMVAIARAMMSSPQLLLLDEPSLGLAPLLVTAVFELISKINEKGISVLLVEQNSAMALSIANRGYVLETGSITLSGSCADLSNNIRVQEAYLGLA